MHSHKQVKEVKGTKRFFKRLFLGSKLDEKLIESVLECDINKMEDLIKKGANINTRDGIGNTSLMLACDFEKFDIVNLLLSKNANIDISNEFGYTAIHFAVQKKDLRLLYSIVNMDDDLIEKRLSKQDQNGNTPLHIAVDYGNANAVDFLLKRKANKKIKNKDGKTALDVAREKKFYDIMILFNKK